MSKNRHHVQDMTPEKAKQLKAHVQAAAFGGKLPPKTCLAIAAILYAETPSEKLNTLEEIEQTVRQKVLKHVSPEIGVFLSERLQGQPSVEQEN